MARKLLNGRDGVSDSLSTSVGRNGVLVPHYWYFRAHPSGEGDYGDVLGLSTVAVWCH